MDDKTEIAILSLLREILARLDENDGQFADLTRDIRQLGRQIEGRRPTILAEIQSSTDTLVRLEVIKGELSTLRRRIELLEETH